MTTLYKRCNQCSRIAVTCPHRHPELPDDGTECPHGIKRPEAATTPPTTTTQEVQVQPTVVQPTSRSVDVVSPVECRVTLPTEVRELNDKLQGLRGRGLPYAKTWLQTLLENGRMPAVEVYGIAATEIDATGKRRFSKRTLDTAKKLLGVKTVRYGCGEGSVYWELQHERLS